MRHRIVLSNGAILLLIEGEHELTLATENAEMDDVDMYVLAVTPSGVMVYPNSGGACQEISEDLKETM